MDIHDFNPSRRRFLSGMLAVGAASALAPNPLISKVWAAGGKSRTVDSIRFALWRF